MLNRFVVASAMQIDIALMELAIQKKDLVRRDIDVIEELFLEPNAVGLWAIGWQAVVLIQGKEDHAGKVQSIFAVQPNEFAKSR